MGEGGRGPLRGALTGGGGRESEGGLGGPLEVAPPLHVARRPQAVNEDHRCAAASVRMVDAKRADLDELRADRFWFRACRSDHECSFGSIRAGAATPETVVPDANRAVSCPLMPLTEPGP